MAPPPVWTRAAAGAFFWRYAALRGASRSPAQASQPRSCRRRHAVPTHWHGGTATGCRRRHRRCAPGPATLAGSKGCWLPSAHRAGAHSRHWCGRCHADPLLEGALPGTPPLADYYLADEATLRRHVDEWARHRGAFDAVMDFDSLLQDPAHPARLAPAFKTGSSGTAPGGIGYAESAA